MLAAKGSFDSRCACGPGGARDDDAIAITDRCLDKAGRPTGADRQDTAGRIHRDLVGWHRNAKLEGAVSGDPPGVGEKLLCPQLEFVDAFVLTALELGLAQCHAESDQRYLCRF